MNFEDVEKARKAYYAKVKSGYTTSLLVATVVSLISLPILGKGIGFSTIIIFLFFFIATFIVGVGITTAKARNEAINYQKAYKAYFIEQNLAKTFTDLQYSHEKGISESTLNRTGMIDTGDVFSSNDLTYAKYKSVSLAQADVKIQERETDSEGNTHYETIFKGRVMLFEFPKKFNFKLELIGRRFGAYRIPSGSEVGRKMAKINTESDEFNHTFKIFGEDGFEAFYILDPAFMVKIMEISEHYKGKVLFGFIENTLLIALNNGNDSFEPPKAGHPIDEKTELDKVSGDIKVITDFVDQLSLDHKLFK